ncbi:peptidase M24, structural domain-containing protein [Infundibulicybe gibba]|nr:peptidase M24, structural domain-containing protein [Infundibulicybe gibba]
MWSTLSGCISKCSQALRKPLPGGFHRSLRATISMGAAGTQTVDTSERLRRLRELMQRKENDVEALVVPSEDQHSSEDPASCDERRAFISGFNGSAGCAVVTLKEAFMFTDGRYFLQAGKQLDQNWTLMKQGLPDVPTWQEFLSKNLEKSTRIGIDPTLISAVDAETLAKTLEPKGSRLVSLEKNLVDIIWEQRPALPHNPVFYLDEKYSGESHVDKIARVRVEMEKKKVKAFIVTMLDEVAWLFNLRGSDIDFNPVFFAYAVVTAHSVVLFIRDNQLEEAARARIAGAVDIATYDSFFDYLRALPGALQLAEDSAILLGDNASLAIAEAVGQRNILVARSPIEDLKAIKNPAELEGFRQSHIRDGVALAQYFSWLEEKLEQGSELNESQGSDQLEKFRSQLELFRGLSFPAISATGPNGAIIHYFPEPTDCAIIKKDQIYLCDSGAQFLDATTDVTRTWHFGTPTEEEKRAFTRVLQGHIAIDTAVFPNGTTGMIYFPTYRDAFARRALWQDGLANLCRHGTGHGVGHFLNVHEGPHGIGARIALNSAPLKPGMTVSNEPGYYADGRFGIRIENIVLVRAATTPNDFGGKGYLGFEHVTMCPIHKKLIDLKLLTAEEKAWVDRYHAEVWEKVSPLLMAGTAGGDDARALVWLKRECAPI